MNCIYVSEIFRSVGMKTEIFTPFACGAMTKLFSKDEANACFAEKKVAFFAGGTGHPYFSTDTTTVLRAIEIEAETILLAKAVDGVYDSDPKTNPNAKKYDSVHIQEVIDQKLAVVDLTASILCMENKMPMLVFGLNEENSIIRAAKGEIDGTPPLPDSIFSGFRIFPGTLRRYSDGSSALMWWYIRSAKTDENAGTLSADC